MVSHLNTADRPSKAGRYLVTLWLWLWPVAVIISLLTIDFLFEKIDRLTARWRHILTARLRHMLHSWDELVYWRTAHSNA